MGRWLPYPLAALGLFLFWLLLLGSVSPGAILLGVVLALAGSGTLAALDLPKTRLRRLAGVPGLLYDVLVEVVRSNNAVARIILRPAGASTHHSGFVRIPLDMRNPYGLAALTCILTATPGTIWVDYDSSESSMLLHVLDLIDQEAWVRIVKDRWERRLMEIFE
ncbi:MAG TPA: Na+/H+ antiporter subunit E [Roseomonas sp.]|nr:Na+/H+ antiporter subunit E [Roseomonas sp.]